MDRDLAEARAAYDQDEAECLRALSILKPDERSKLVAWATSWNESQHAADTQALSRDQLLAVKWLSRAMLLRVHILELERQEGDQQSG